jgi:hypothetical protein
VSLPASDHEQWANLASPAALAATFYGVEQPTDAQCAAVRRALRGLETRGLVIRWTSRIRGQGDPSRWSRNP